MPCPVTDDTATIGALNGFGGTVSFSDLATFSDPGFDNPLNPNPAMPPGITDPLHESFTYDINWGDGRDAANPREVGREERA